MDGFVPEDEDSLEIGKFEHVQQVICERHLAPPAYGQMRRCFAGGGLVMDGRRGHRVALARGQIQQGRVERIHLVAFAGGAFGEEDDAVSVSQGFFDQSVNPEDISSIRSIDEATRASGTKLVLYATPVNFSYIRAKNGRKEETLARTNLRKVIAFCEEREITVLDFAEVLPEEFVLGIGPTASHLTGEGRDELARLIADALRREGLVN